MIIKQEPKKTLFSFKTPLIIVIILAITAMAYLTLKDTFKKEPSILFCDAETIIEDDFSNDRILFANGHTRSNEKAFEGEYSSKLNGQNLYSMRYTLKRPIAGDIYEVTMFCYGNIDFIRLVAAGNEGADFYDSTNQIAEKNGDWNKLKLFVIIPKNKKLKEINFYAYVINDEAIAYIDNFKIEKIESKKQTNDSINNLVNVQLDDVALKKINQKRNEAINNGILVTDEDSWVKGKFLVSDSIENNIKLRLKGDWTDHLKGDQWSYRIKMKDDVSWNGMIEFSIQTPKARHFLKEWVFHKFLDYEDVLTTKYDFVPISVNNMKSELYAYEEHFLKQIPESNHRREGVIIKFGEDSMWDRLLNGYKNGVKEWENINDERLVTNVEAFKSSKIESSEVLKEQWTKAYELLSQYQHEQNGPEEIFDIDRLAKYYVICDILEAFHSIIWHNQRFYYNGLTQKLEPIGFDGFTENGELEFPYIPYWGSFKNNNEGNVWNNYYAHLFKDDAFSSAYAQYLKEFSKLEYLNKFWENIVEDLHDRAILINQYYPEYKLDKNRIFNKAAQIRVELKGVNNISLKGYKSNVKDDQVHVELLNVHHLPIKVIHSSINKIKDLTSIPTSVNTLVLSSKPTKYMKYFDISIPKEHQYIYWKVNGLEEIHISKLFNFAPPSYMNTIHDKSLNLNIPIDSNLYAINNKNISITKGDYTLSSPMIIPKDYTLTIFEGAKIELKSNAYILSYGNIALLGTEEMPIKIYSTEKNQGFVVMDPQTKVVINHTVFDGLNNLTENEWQLTGAVTLYESKLEMNHVVIKNNDCEDALNLIRSEFNINKLHVSHTLSDGFDADFCKGKIAQSIFINTGNDGLDFSGSQITVEDCLMKNIGDKGISCGEQSTVNILNNVMNGAVIGVASKDKSVVKINNIELNSCNTGLTAYQKKPEYGGGTLDVEKLSSADVKFLFKKDGVSKIIIDHVEQ